MDSKPTYTASKHLVVTDELINKLKATQLDPRIAEIVTELIAFNAFLMHSQAGLSGCVTFNFGRNPADPIKTTTTLGN